MKRFVRVARRLAIALAVLLAVGAIFLDHVLRYTGDFLGWLTPSAVYRIDPADGSRRVALTIDDGPSPATPEILDVLAEHDVHATFFLVGDRVAEHPELVARIRAEGHEIAHHGKTLAPSARLDADVFAAEFDATDALLRAADSSPSWFRPASGWYGTAIRDHVQARGYRLVLGNVFPFDSHLPSVDFCGWFVARGIHPGAIVILHDGEHRGPRTADVLRDVLPTLAERGYEVTTLSDCWDRSARDGK